MKTQNPFWLPALAMAVLVVASNFLVQVHINEWLTWGALSYPVTYWVTDVCNRWAGPALARKVAWLGFGVGVIMSLVLAPLQIAAASGAAFIVSQLLDISFFNRLRRMSWWRAPLIGSVIASFVDTVIFFSLAFYGSHFVWWKLGLGDYSIKVAMALILLIPFRLIMTRLPAWTPPARPAA